MNIIFYTAFFQKDEKTERKTGVFVHFALCLEDYIPSMKPPAASTSPS